MSMALTHKITYNIYQYFHTRFNLTLLTAFIRFPFIFFTCFLQPAKVAQSILLFCKGQGLLTSVAMPGVDRTRAYSTSSSSSNDGNYGPRRLSRGMSMEEYDKPNIRRLSITVNNDGIPATGRK